MLFSRRSHSSLLRLIVGGLAATAASICSPAPASAHFVLTTPAATMNQGALGDPQKLAPCGDDGSGTATGKVTAYKAGDTVTITVDEKIFHVGHYRVSLGVNGPGDLPDEPATTAGPKFACDKAAVEATPVFPVLADGVLDHTAPFNGPQTFTVTLPSNVSCDHCTLQVLEFMSDHGKNAVGGCFYHHCANISISGGMSSTTSTGAAESSAASGTGSDSTGASGSGAGGASGTTAAGAGGAGGSGQNDQSSGCQLTAIPASSSGLAGLAGALALAAVVRRRRK